MQRMSKSLLAVVLVCGLAVGFAAMGQTMLRVTYAWPTYADPAVGSDYSSSSTFVNLYDSLVYPTLEGDVKPHLAEVWESSDDGLIWTFYLRKGINFHDGTELTAEDVKFSMDRLLTIGEGYGYLFLGRVESVEVVDAYTIRFTLAQSFGPFLTNLVRLYVLNKDLVMANLEDGPYSEYGDYGKKFLLTNDAGSGAYFIKEFPLEEYVLMEKYPDYWGYNYTGMTNPNMPDQIQFIATTEAMTVRTMMANQELEISDQPDRGGLCDP
jgi:peptide/nickel transport system substrate-binding protein